MLVVLETWKSGSREESIAEFTLEKMKVRTRVITEKPEWRVTEEASWQNLGTYVENKELQVWVIVVPLKDSEQNREAGLRQLWSC